MGNLLKLRVHIDRIAAIQYIAIYLMIQYIGGRVLATLGTDIFFGGTICMCILLLVLFPLKLAISKKFFNFIVTLAMSMFLSFIITGGALGIGTILSVLSRFLLVYIAIGIDYNNFVDRFLKITYIMAIISVVEFVFVQIVGTSRALVFFSQFHEVKNSVGWLGSSYGLFLICYNFMEPARNSYMFGEPGEYQSLLITALFFLVFYFKQGDSRLRAKYCAAFLIALITVQSTTGYLNLIALVIAILLTNKSKVPSLIYKMSVTLLIILGLYMLFFYSDSSFIYKNFIGKIFNEAGKLDLATNTGIARIGPLERFVETIATMPEKLIFGVGYEGLFHTPLGGYSTDGIINLIAMLGIISFCIIYGKMIVSTVTHSVSIMQTIFTVFYIVNVGISQPSILAITSVLVCMYDEYCGERSAILNHCESCSLFSGRRTSI